MTHTLRMGGYQGSASVHTRAALVLASDLASRTNGDCTIALTTDVTALGRPSTDLFRMVEGDELDLCYFASSYLVARVPALAVFDLPFTVAIREALYAKLDGELGRLVAAEVARHTGYVVLGYWDNGFRHFSNGVRAIVRPEDCRGLSIRTMNSAVHQQTFKALGFSPRFIDVKDFPEAVRSRSVDAQENPLTNTLNFGVHETHRHVTMTGHFAGVALVLGNARRIGALPADVRAALDGAMVDATRAQRGYAAEDDRVCLEALERAGVAVVRPDDVDRNAFVAATAAVRERTAQAIAPEILRAFGG